MFEANAISPRKKKKEFKREEMKKVWTRRERKVHGSEVLITTFFHLICNFPKRASI